MLNFGYFCFSNSIALCQFLPPHILERAYVFSLTWNSSSSSQYHLGWSKVGPPDASFAEAAFSNCSEFSVPSTTYHALFLHVNSELISSGKIPLPQ